MELDAEQRFVSGEFCVEPARYVFDGYVDGSFDPPPSVDEMEIAPARGEVFPPIQNPPRACYWRLVDGVVLPESPEAEPEPESA
jgi:hypothetical protein